MDADPSFNEERVLCALQEIATDQSYGEPLATGTAEGSVYERCFRTVNADPTLPPIDMISMVAAMASLWDQEKIAEGPLSQTFWVVIDQPSLVAA
jgi:hypothetical protein